MCLNPKWIYKKGYRKQTTYNGLEGSFYELGQYTQCGTCSQCIATRANNWVVRNHYESMRHDKKCFITLTYAKSPIILVRKDFQNFIKRFRRYLDYHEKGTKVRIFYAGEYGSIGNRPHAHIIIYGWEDPNAKILTINKKNQIVMQSSIIQKTWRLGRTSYQKFSDKEAPYISLYSTDKESFKKAYKISREKLRKLEDYARSYAKLDDTVRKNLQEELKKAAKALEDEKMKYYKVKEFNGWSTALGWDKFEEQYNKASKYVFEEYILDGTYPTPSSWIKKLANEGDIQAAVEMQRRVDEADKETDETKVKLKALSKEAAKKKEDILKYADEKDKIEVL